MAKKKDLSNIWLEFSQKGDTQSFERLYDACKTQVFLIAYKYMRSKPESEDITQDVLTQIYEKREDYKQVENFISWIRIVTINVCKKRLEKLKRRNTEVCQITDWQLKGRATYNEAESNIDREKIQDMIFDLSPRYFKEILTYRIDGYSNPEIAEIIGKSEKYVRDRKHLACKRLLQKLSNNGYGLKEIGTAALVRA